MFTDNGPTRVPVRNGTILFNPITLDDAGWYQCTASHLGNNVSSYSVYLNVRGGSSLPVWRSTGHPMNRNFFFAVIPLEVLGQAFQNSTNVAGIYFSRIIWSAEEESTPCFKSSRLRPCSYT